jgi:proline iminopeptidase
MSRLFLFYLSICLWGIIPKINAQADSLFVTTSDGVKLFVKKAGKGSPMLFIHGGPGSNSFYFEKEGGSIFEKECTVIYLDQRGCGRSSIPENKDYSLSRVVKDFDEVRQVLGYKSWNVMAHSFGGILATEYAVQFPKTIKSMVYLNCTISILDSGKSVIKKTIELLPELSTEEVASLENESIPLLNRYFEAFGKMQQHNKKYLLQFEDKKNADRDDRLMDSPFLKWDMGQHIFTYPEYLVSFAPKTALIKQKVLVIGGKKDYAIGVNHPDLMRFPNKKIVYINGSHGLYAEHTQELFEVVSTFLK